jgi:hypothetical protein
VTAGAFYIGLGWTWRAFALALMGGFLLTLMTHMQHSTDSDGVGDRHGAQDGVLVHKRMPPPRLTALRRTHDAARTGSQRMMKVALDSLPM